MGKVGSYLFSLKMASWFSLFLLIDVFSSVSTEGIFVSASAGMTFGRSSREPKYKIVFHSASSPFHPDNEQESLVMTDKEGQSYICFLPIVEETKHFKPVAQPNSTSLILETDWKIKQKTPDELIEGIKENCIYRHEGWWSYEFCHQKHVRQLHLEDDKPVQEYLLGVFDPTATADFNQNQSDATVLKDPRSKDASQRYHAHMYSNGTLCDLTNQPRETEIRFVCSEPSVVISSIKEISTCKYVVMVQCPMLCKHPMFHQERPMWHIIHCNEDLKDTKAATEEQPKATKISLLDDDSGVVLMEKVNWLASQKPVVIFSLGSCCMCHTVKSLFVDLGVNADVHELDEEPLGRELQMALVKLIGRNPPVPVVFIGGRLVGSTDKVMSLHLGGKLVQLLRDAGALWL